MLENDIKKVLLTSEEITAGTKQLGQTLTKEFQGKNPLLIGILKGSIPFMAELIKHMDMHLETDYMVVSSYQGTTASTGTVKIIKDLDADITGRDVIIVEDIIDTGRTLKELRELLKVRKPNSVTIVTMLDKPEGRVVEIDADHTVFTIPNEFVVGFGLDYKENYRNLPYVGVLKEEVYTN